MKKNIESVLYTKFIKQTPPLQLLTFQELYEQASNNNFDLSKPHRIEFNALIIVLEGNSKHTVDFKKLPIYNGVIIPITKGQIHSFSKNPSIKGYIIGFEEIFVYQNINDKNLFHFLQIFHTPNIKIGEKNINSLNQFLILIKTFLTDKNPYLKVEIIHSTFMALLFQIKRLSCKQNISFDSKKFKKYHLFKKMINNHHNEIHSAKDYAKKLNISYNYLNEICKEITNKTAKEFIDNWLLLEIKRKILEKKHTSQEIAFQMGFKEPSNFIRFFKKHTNITPKEFRNIQIKKEFD